jgi:hypothetical protein
MVTGAGCDAEVGELAHAPAVDQNVFRLIVAVNDTAPVRRRQAHQRALQHHQSRLDCGAALADQDLAQ